MKPPPDSVRPHASQPVAAACFFAHHRLVTTHSLLNKLASLSQLRFLFWLSAILGPLAFGLRPLFVRQAQALSGPSLRAAKGRALLVFFDAPALIRRSAQPTATASWVPELQRRHGRGYAALAREGDGSELGDTQP